MEGDRRITLLEPVRTGVDEFGADVFGDPREYVTWALRRDLRGGDDVEADTEVGEWPTRFQIRQDPRFDLTADWSGWQVRDEEGRLCDVQAVAEPPFGRRRYWWLYCSAWTSLDAGEAPPAQETFYILDGQDNFITDGAGNRLTYQ